MGQYVRDLNELYSFLPKNVIYFKVVSFELNDFVQSLSNSCIKSRSFEPLFQVHKQEIVNGG